MAAVPPPLREAARLLRERMALEPRVAIVIGGAGEGIAAGIDVESVVACRELPGFPEEGADRQRLLVGRLAGVPVAALQGEAVLTEARSVPGVAFAVRLLGLAGRLNGGPPLLLVTGTCGSLDPLWRRGDLVLLDDHINLTGRNPLAGAAPDALGPRFPDMTEPYDRGIGDVAAEVALDRRIPLRRGVYVAITGPGPATRAEARMLRWMGADVVGTTIVWEVIVARHMGMPVLGLTVVTHAQGPADAGAEGEAVVRAPGEDAAARLAGLVGGTISRLAADGPRVPATQ